MALAALGFAFATTPTEAAPPHHPVRAMAYEPVACESLPDEAVRQVPGAAAPYALIACSETGTSLAAVNGFLWMPVERPGEPYQFPAPRRRGHDTSYFARATSRELSSEAVDWANGLLRSGYRIGQRFERVAQLEIVADSGLIYNIYFFIAGDRPVYVLGCTDRCRANVLLREYSMAEARAAMGRRVVADTPVLLPTAAAKR
ncbi:MAG: hypothetical protein ACREVL_07605 [Solimonas sp.]